MRRALLLTGPEELPHLAALGFRRWRGSVVAPLGGGRWIPVEGPAAGLALELAPAELAELAERKANDLRVESFDFRTPSCRGSRGITKVVEDRQGDQNGPILALLSGVPVEEAR